MALPKRQISTSRGAKRRTHQRLANPTLTTCAHCGATVEPHHVCLDCGYYRGRQVLVIPVKDEKK